MTYTPEQITAIRLAVAKELGWTGVNVSTIYKPFGVYGYCPNEKCRTTIPNWPEDLNACHEAEKSLRVDELEAYLRHLVPNEAQWIKYPMNAYWLICHATSLQRCEAFLKVKGAWPL